MIGYRWRIIKKIYKRKLHREYIEGEIDEYTYLISILINKLDNFTVRKAYIAKISIFSKDKIEKYKNINQIIDIYQKGIIKRYMNKNSTVYEIILKAGCINILAKNLYDAFILRKIGHSSGYKYSKVYLDKKYPILRIEGTENIIIPVDHEIDIKLEKILNKILPEFINRNIKRAFSLIKNLEKLKY